MSIPLASTTVSILRPLVTINDPYNDNTGTDYSTVESGIRAHISSPSGREIVRGGEQADVSFHLSADPCDLDHADRIVDEMTGATYLVDWTFDRPGFGLDHVEAGIRKIVGLV